MLIQRSKLPADAKHSFGFGQICFSIWLETLEFQFIQISIGNNKAYFHNSLKGLYEIIHAKLLAHTKCVKQVNFFFS